MCVKGNLNKKEKETLKSIRSNHTDTEEAAVVLPN